MGVRITNLVDRGACHTPRFDKLLKARRDEIAQVFDIKMFATNVDAGANANENAAL